MRGPVGGTSTHPSPHAPWSLVEPLFTVEESTEAWLAFLEGWRQALDGRAVAVHVYDWRRGGQFPVWRGLEPDAVKAYRDYYSRCNVWMARARERGPIGDLIVSDELITPSEWRRTEIFVDYMRHLDLARSLGLVLKNAPGQVVTVTTLRGDAAGPFSPLELDLAREEVLPHVRAALALHERLARARCGVRIREAALEAYATGVLLLSPERRVVYANGAARKLLRSGDGFHCPGDRLEASLPEEQGRLEAALKAVTGSGPDGRAAPQPRFLRLGRTPPRRPLEIFLSPFRKGGDVAPRVAAILFVSDPEQATPSAADTVASLYRLTAAETRLLRELATGDPLPEIAFRLGIAHETARVHLKRVFAKTRTHRQPELQRLLLATAGSWRERGTSDASGGDFWSAFAERPS